MEALLDKPIVDELKHLADEGALRKEVGGMTKELDKKFEAYKTAASQRIEDSLLEGKKAAERLAKRTKYAVEDCVEETTHQIKKHPYQAIGMAFAAGALLGVLIPRRKP